MRVDTRTAEERRQYQRDYYLANRARKLAASIARGEAKKEAKRAYDRQRYAADPKRYKDARLQSGNRWAKNHPDRAHAKLRRRVAAQMRRLPAWADHAAIRLMYCAADVAKTTWPELDVQVDHVIPLRGGKVSGLHVHNNLRLVPARVNQSKGNRFEPD